jgi:RNA-splicing ligase RtcB
MKWQCEKIYPVKSLRAGPLCLPNLHHKENLEVPSPFVAATEGTIVPMFSAPSMNCGMGLIMSTLTKNDIDETFFEKFSRLMRREVSPRFSRFKTFLLWLGLAQRPHLKYDLSVRELEEVMLHGARAVLQKYTLPKEMLAHIEHEGQMFRDEEKQNVIFSEILPRSSYTNGLHDMGFNFGGNHFLETHYVEEIIDEQAANKFGLRKDQIVFFYHGGGGHATYHLGRYFARRAKNTALEKIILFWLKLFFHFGSWQGLRRARERWRYYFSRTPFPEIPLATEEGKRLMQSVKAGLNYGYAFRAALFARVRDALIDMGYAPETVSLLYDAAHNTIFEETYDSTPLVVHRQDAMVARRGMPVFIAGYNNTRSYIGVGIDAPGASIGSVSASAAITIKKIDGQKIDAPGASIGMHTTTIYRHKEPLIKTVEHISDDGLLAVAREFEKDGIIKPVALIRPLAVIKGPR